MPQSARKKAIKKFFASASHWRLARKKASEKGQMVREKRILTSRVHEPKKGAQHKRPGSSGKAARRNREYARNPRTTRYSW
jgi:hypothetical protein